MIEEHRKTYWFVDLLGAFVCGFLVGVEQDFVAHSGDEISFANFMSTVLLAIGSYSLAALVLPIWKTRPFRKLPDWILILVLGAVVYYFCIHSVGTVTYAWKFRYTQPELNTAQYVLSYVWQFSTGLFFVTIIDCLLALPIMGVIHYLGSKLIGMLDVRRTHAA